MKEETHPATGCTKFSASYGKYLVLKTQALEQRAELFAEYEKLIEETKNLSKAEHLVGSA